MALASRSIPITNFDFLRRIRLSGLGVSAVVLAFVSALAAFVILVAGDRGQPRIMINEQVAPAARRGVLAQPLTARATLETAGAAPADSAGADPQTQHPFVLARGADSLPLGSIGLRLGKTDADRKLYDVTVLMGGRSYSHKKVKASQPLWITVDHGKKSMELVADQIGEDSISGYWLEMSRSMRSTRVNSNRTNTKSRSRRR